MCIRDREYIDLIISDIMMPVMDGYELVSELRSAGYQIPVLMITAKGSFDDMRQGFLSDVYKRQGQHSPNSTRRIVRGSYPVSMASCFLAVTTYSANMGLCLLYTSRCV